MSSASFALRADEDLPHERLAGPGGGAERDVVGRDRAPAEHRLAFLGDDVARRPSRTRRAGPRPGGRKTMPTPYSPAAGRVTRASRATSLRNSCGDLDQDARAVAGVGLAAAGAAVVQVQQDLQRLLDDRVGLPALDVDHEAHAAGVVLELRVIKPLSDQGTSPWRPTVFVSTVHFRRHLERQACRCQRQPNLGSIGSSWHGMQSLP